MTEEKDDQVASKEAIGELIDMTEAIDILKTTRSTFYRWLRSGKIKGMKVGRQWRFYREDIERFLRGQEPRIDLPADISPLIKTLRERIEQLGGEVTLPDQPELQPVVEAMDLMILLAIRMRASDIHLAPHTLKDGGESVAILRYRVDGVLNQVAEIDTRLLPAIIERWKAMAACDVHEKRRPQDGRIMIKTEGREFDLRVCFLPTVLGESLTVCILDPGNRSMLSIDQIGFAPRDKERILRWLGTPWGMIVVCGPTGSGKRTVLYGFLGHVTRPEIKVLTIEDPVEYLLPWMVQVQVQPDVGVTYAPALRAVLRSDPDVIMVAELRDRETLAIAQQCALTGHLVMTTMHANDSVSALKRMVEIGSHPYIIGESTKLIIAQRLVRKLCTDCSVEQQPPAELLKRAEEIARAGGLDWDSLPKKFREPVGCAKCNQTGYRGRTIIAETLEVTPEISAALGRSAPVEELRAIAVEQGMTTMAADGVRRAAMGITSFAEVTRVLLVLV